MWPAKTKILQLVPLHKMFVHACSKRMKKKGFTECTFDLLGLSLRDRDGQREGAWSEGNDLNKSPRAQVENNGDRSHLAGIWFMKGEEETGRVVCGGMWAKKVDHAVTKDITVARKNFMEFLQRPLSKDDNDENEDDFFHKRAL